MSEFVKQLGLVGQAAGGVFSGINMLIVAGAVLLGLVVGAIPGLTGTMALALLINLTYKLPSDQAVAFMLGVYVGAVSGGLFSAIMLNIPGTPNAAATALDGYPLAMKGKGGRNNEQIFTQADEKAAVLALKAGKEPDERIFDRRAFANDADLHHMRQQRAVEVYNRIVEDMRLHPERREYYKQIVHDGFERRGRTCKENLDNPYVVRGQNRQHQISEAREVSYDRCAVLAVSVMVLNHCRSDVTVQHYIQKG